MQCNVIYPLLNRARGVVLFAVFIGIKPACLNIIVV